jgi:spore coat protein JB
MISASSHGQSLADIQAISFQLVDLQLYLDTHPGDLRARERYRALQHLLDKRTRAYARDFGPLRNYGLTDAFDPEAWVRDPWPWES